MTPEKPPEVPPVNQPSSEPHPATSRNSALLANDRALSILGHELRNPIAAIVMAAEALSRLCADAPDKRAMTDVIYRQARHANRLLEELLEVSRLASGGIELHKQRIDLVDQLRNVLAARQAPADAKRAAVHAQLPPQPIWIDADSARLAQAIGNLVDHRCDSGNHSDRLVVTASLTRDGHQVLVEIQDSGMGVEPATLATIFEPFAPAHGNSRHGRAGLGLGLALAKGLIELHGGKITAESAGVGQGGCFRIVLPLADEPAVRPIQECAAPGVQQPLRILIIEDSPDVVTSLQFLLKASGHEISVASSGKEGIESARRLRPDVILCDIGLPDIDGYAVAQAIRADSASAKSYLIAVSGYGSQEDQRRSIAAGFDLHLNKPEGFVGLNERLAGLPIGRL